MKKNLLITLTFFLLVHLSNAQIPQLWGTASNGGGHNNGAIFKINGDGTGFTTVYSLTGTNGSFPGDRLVLSGDGMFYGQAFEGGNDSSGVLFKIDPVTNAYTDLFNIDTIGPVWDNSDLVRANDTTFYGLICSGGADSLGQLFRFNPANDTYTILHHFNFATGAQPRTIMMAADNKLYGTTNIGGVDSLGFLYSYDPVTNTYAALHENDSTYSTGPPVQAANGKLYGLTSGGPGGSDGSIYSYDPNTSTYAKLYDFVGNNGYPSWNNALIQGTDGMFYGMNEYEGDSSLGVIFRFNPTGNIYTVLYSFGNTSGNSPVSRLMQASDGKLYGMTYQGGINDDGTIFSFDLTDSIFTKLKDFSTSSGYNPFGSLTELPAANGIAEPTLANEMQLYPNPVTDQLILHSFSLHSDIDITISIMNALGEVLMTEKRPWENNLIFDTKRFSAGMYFVHLSNEAEVWTGRFVKE